MLRVGHGIPEKHQFWRGQQHCPQLTAKVTHGWTHLDVNAPVPRSVPHPFYIDNMTRPGA